MPALRKERPLFIPSLIEHTRHFAVQHLGATEQGQRGMLLAEMISNNRSNFSIHPSLEMRDGLKDGRPPTGRAGG